MGQTPLQRGLTPLHTVFRIFRKKSLKKLFDGNYKKGLIFPGSLL